MHKYKVGIIGCGRIAGYLEDDPLRGKPCTHVGVYQSIPSLKVTSCCSRTESNATRFAERFSIKECYTDYRKMLAEEDLDIVSIATYAPSHCEITKLKRLLLFKEKHCSYFLFIFSRFILLPPPKYLDIYLPIYF